MRLAHRQGTDRETRNGTGRNLLRRAIRVFDDLCRAPAAQPVPDEGQQQCWPTMKCDSGAAADRTHPRAEQHGDENGPGQRLHEYGLWACGVAAIDGLGRRPAHCWLTTVPPVRPDIDRTATAASRARHRSAAETAAARKRSVAGSARQPHAERPAPCGSRWPSADCHAAGTAWPMLWPAALCGPVPRTD